MNVLSDSQRKIGRKQVNLSLFLLLSMFELLNIQVRECDKLKQAYLLNQHHVVNKKTSIIFNGIHHNLASKFTLFLSDSTMQPAQNYSSESIYCGYITYILRKL